MDNENIEEILNKLGAEDVPAEVCKIAEDASEKFSKTLTQSRQHILWENIMKTRITKLAAAAVIVIAVLVGINQLGGSVDGASVAWGDVTHRVARVDYVHLYYLKSRGNDFIRHFEAWYANGKLVIRGNKGYMVYDDGQMEQGFDEHGRRTTKGLSKFAKGQTFLEIISGGLLSDKNEQLAQQIPANVGDDFLIYDLAPPAEEPDSEWIESISITVGKNSLLPVQMKVYHKDSDYDLIMFDYEAPEKPAEFFEPPIVASPNVRSEVVLDAEEVAIDIEGAPGLKQAIICLHDKYDGPADQFPLDYVRSDHLTQSFCRAVSESLRKDYKKKGGPIFKLDVTFVTDEGYRSQTHDVLVLWLNEAQQCGTRSSAVGLDNWPDGKYRNIRYSPLLKPTDREDTYIVEIGCWLRPKED